MPYRVDLASPSDDALDRLVDLGALDAEIATDGRLAAVRPDGITPDQVASALGVERVSVSPAIGRDNGSVWVLGPQAVRVGRLQIVPAGAGARAEPGALQLIDAAAFGTGLHPTTALCLEALQAELAAEIPTGVLDVGTGSGVLALAALMMGVPRALGIDVDPGALDAAADNA